MNEEKINQILMNQATIMVTLSSLYSNETEDIEVLNQLLKRHKEVEKLFNPELNPTIAERTHDALSDNSQQDEMVVFSQNTTSSMLPADNTHSVISEKGDVKNG